MDADTKGVLRTVNEALRAIDLDLTMQRAARIALEGEVRELREEVAKLGGMIYHQRADSLHSVKVDAP